MVINGSTQSGDIHLLNSNPHSLARSVPHTVVNTVNVADYRGPKAGNDNEDEFSVDYLIWEDMQVQAADLQPP